MKRIIHYGKKLNNVNFAKIEKNLFSPLEGDIFLFQFPRTETPCGFAGHYKNNVNDNAGDDTQDEERE